FGTWPAKSSILNPFCSFSLPGTVASFSGLAGIGGGATGANFIAASVFGRPIRGEPGGSGCGLSAGALAAGAGAAGACAGCCCATAGSVIARVPRVPATSTARRPEDRNVIVILPDAGTVSPLLPATDGAPSTPVSDFCNRRAIAELAPL